MYCTGVVVVVVSVSEAYLWGGESVEGKAAIVVRDPAGGNTTEGVEGVAQGLELGLHEHAVRTTPRRYEG